MTGVQTCALPIFIGLVGTRAGLTVAATVDAVELKGRECARTEPFLACARSRIMHAMQVGHATASFHQHGHARRTTTKMVITAIATVACLIPIATTPDTSCGIALRISSATVLLISARTFQRTGHATRHTLHLTMDATAVAGSRIQIAPNRQAKCLDADLHPTMLAFRTTNALPVLGLAQCHLMELAMGATATVDPAIQIATLTGSS